MVTTSAPMLDMTRGTGTVAATMAMSARGITLEAPPIMYAPHTANSRKQGTRLTVINAQIPLRTIYSSL
jgi:hypothetical protein